MLKNIFKRKKLSLYEKALKRIKANKPVSATCKGMFDNETSESLAQRFKAARKAVEKNRY